MPKPQSDREVNEGRPDGPVELVVPAAEAAEGKYITLIHPVTGEELPTVEWVAKELVKQGWKSKLEIEKEK